MGIKVHLICFFFITCFCTKLQADSFFPKAGDTLWVTQFYFSYPASFEKDEVTIKVEVIVGENKKGKKFKSDKICCFAEGFKPGYSYKWKYKYRSKKTWNDGGVFHIATYDFVNTNNIKVVLKDSLPKDFKGYIALDGLGAIINRKAEPQFFLRGLNQTNEKHLQVRDLRLTPLGTVSFLKGNKAFEFTFDFDTVWSVQNISCHHDFQITPDGHKWVLYESFKDEEIDFSKINQDELRVNNGIKCTENGCYFRYDYGGLIEFDINGSKLWSFDDSINFSKNNFFCNESCCFQNYQKLHLNAFTLNKNYVYISYCDLNQVFKINKQSKQLSDFFGYGSRCFNSNFAFQHNISFNGNEFLMLNNNARFLWKIQSNQKELKKESSIQVYELVDNIPLLKKEIPLNASIGSMGGVDFIKNKFYLVTMGVLNRTMIMDTSGNCFWFLELWKDGDKLSKEGIQSYRTHYVPTLYPVFYDAQILQMNEKTELVIFNGGLDDCKYICIYRNSFGKVVKEENSYVKASNEVRIQTSDKFTEVEIVSEKQPYFSKKINCGLQK